MKKNMKNLIILMQVAAVPVFAGLAHAQNFGLINQQPTTQNQSATESHTAATESHAVTSTQRTYGQGAAMRAYEAARPYMASDIANSHYTLGPNDVLTITVQRHPEVSGKYIINMEGKIQFDFVGDIVLSGMTKDEAAKVVIKRLQKYIIKPDVTVVITEYNSKVVYVVGEVGAPGKIYMRSDTMSLRDALLAANLPQLTAATDKATLFTPSANGDVVLKKVNVYNLLFKGDLRENYIMKPGDTIYLPPTLWAKIARFLNPITQPIGQAAGSAAAVAAI